MDPAENIIGILTDELIVDADKVPLIEDSKERLEQCYRVRLEYGLKATDTVTPKQWITIEGQPEDRIYAKNYIRALCNAEETLCIEYPVELHSILSNPKIHTQLERQSKTAISFDPGRIGEACISGMDTLAVTLAFSAVEDIISKYTEDGCGDDILESPISRLASSRLDTELQRLRSQDKEILYDEDYSKMPDAVKRSILNWYLEDDTGENTSSQPSAVSGTDTTEKYVSDVAAQLTNVQINSGPLKKRVPSEMNTADTVGYLAKPSDFVVSSSPSESSLPLVSLPQENSLLKETGRSHGYTDKEIDAVLAAASGPMRTSEFIKALVAHRKLEKNPPKKIGNEKTILVADTTEKHPMDDFLASGSPNTKSKHSLSQSPILKADSGNQQVIEDYFAKLSQDFEEEGGEVPLDELKRRSRERQKLLRDVLMKQNAESEEEAAKAGASEDDKQLVGSPDNTDGWARAGARPKKQRNKKNGQRQSPLFGATQQNPSNNQSDKKSTYSSSPTKDLSGFKLPNSPKKRTTGQNQQTMQGHSPHRKKTTGAQRFNNENRSPSPAKGWKDRQSPRDPQQQSTNSAFLPQPQASRQHELNAVRNQHTKAPENAGQDTFGTIPMQQPFMANTQPQQKQFTGTVPIQAQPPAMVRGRNSLRYIIIDGSNVAMAHGNQQMFSCRGIQLCVDFFLERGHTQITAFVPQWRSRTNLAPGYEVYDQHILEELREKGFLVYTPARRVPGKNIVCYDDRFVIRLAQQTDGIIVSNDNYRDLWHQHSDWRKIIEERLLMYSFVGDIFMPPDDPLGRNGPNLDEFLQKPDLLGGFQGAPLRQQIPANNTQRFADRNPPVMRNAWNKVTPPQTHQLNYVPQGYKPHGGNQQHYAPRAIQHTYQQPTVPFTPRYTGPQQRMPVATRPVAQPNNPKPIRTTEVTGWLQANLEKIFTDDADKITRILENHPFETDMNKLSSYILEVL